MNVVNGRGVDADCDPCNNTLSSYAAYISLVGYRIGGGCLDSHCVVLGIELDRPRVLCVWEVCVDIVDQILIEEDLADVTDCTIAECSVRQHHGILMN